MELDFVIAGGRLADGTGGPVRRADVGMTGDRIVAVGDLAGASARERIDVTGRLVTPGFVDLHGHSDWTLLSDGRARSKVHQGITTEVTGNCGLTPFPAPPAHAAAIRSGAAIVDFDPAVPLSWDSTAGYRRTLAAAGIAINAAVLTGHVALRLAVGGDTADPLEAAGVARIEAEADRALDEGAVGISTGLMYPPAMFARPDELDALGRAVARHDALFAVHMRNYGDTLLEAVEEALGVARRTGCRLQVSHLAVAGRRNWGKVRRSLERIDAARAEGLDIGADIYPYLAGSANLSQLLPAWAQEGGSPAVTARLADRAVRDRIRAEWIPTLHLGWEEVVVSLVDEPLAPLVLGRTIAQAAEALGLPPDEACLELIARTEDRVQMVAFGRSPDDLLAVLEHPAGAIGSDGIAFDPDGPTGRGRPHPRSYGCYPRLLGRLVREEGTLPLERAVAMSTSIPAARARLAGRGVVAPGAFADLVVLDPATVIDEATFESPARFATGIDHVLVNGSFVLRAGRQVDEARPGRVLERG